MKDKLEEKKWEILNIDSPYIQLKVWFHQFSQKHRSAISKSVVKGAEEGPQWSFQLKIKVNL